MKKLDFYERKIDAGHGRQVVAVRDGVIEKQWLEANQGYYTGDGNPEWVGKGKGVLRGKGFKKISGNRYSNMLEYYSDNSN
jgi:hypothetical protein